MLFQNYMTVIQIAFSSEFQTILDCVLSNFCNNDNIHSTWHGPYKSVENQMHLITPEWFDSDLKSCF